MEEESKMKKETQIIIAASLVLLFVFGAMSWLSYQYGASVAVAKISNYELLPKSANQPIFDTARYTCFLKTPEQPFVP
jgi:hypothetical protein